MAKKKSTKSVDKVEVKEVEKKKEVVFKSSKPYLWVGELGVQFKNGEYKTSDEREITYLRKLANVTEEK